jgi:hypothetical protein
MFADGQRLDHQVFQPQRLRNRKFGMDPPARSLAAAFDDFTAQGFAVLKDVLTEGEVAGLIADLAYVGNDRSVRRRGSSSYGIRNLLQLAPAVRALAHSFKLRHIVDRLAGPKAKPVRGIYFDKTPEANWSVSWHQDLSIAVRGQEDVDGFGGWSVKAGVPHVQPPVEILATMLTIRLHLDDTDEQNGALRVIPGSHTQGRLTANAIRQSVEQTAPTCCVVPRGGALLMRPLLLHASSAATSAAHRRVIHIEYASVSLPGGLEWHES